MSSVSLSPLTPETDYKAPNDLDLSRQVWDLVFGSIGARLRGLEGRDVDYEATLNLLTTQALEVISASITEEVDAQRARFVELSALADDLEDTIVDIQAGGVEARNVRLSPIDGFTPTSVQQAAAVLANLASIYPLPAAGDANKFLRANSTGTGYVFNEVSFDAINASIAAQALVIAAQAAANLLIERQTRLSALNIAELRGDRLNMVDGIVDPYTDSSDVISTATFALTSGVFAVAYTPSTNQATSAYAIDGGSDPSGPSTNAFDGTTSTWISSQLGGAIIDAAYIGQAFPSPVNVMRVTVRNSATRNNAPSNLAIQYSDTGTPGSWVEAFSASSLAGTENALNTLDIPDVGAHRYWRAIAKSSTPINSVWRAAELEFIQRPAIYPSATLQSVAFPSDVSSPKLVRLAVQIAPSVNTSSPTVNAELISSVSRNGGATFTPVALALVEALADGTKLFEGFADVSGQSAGSSMVYRHVTANSIDVRISGTVMQWRA